ncbi:MinD-like ATPase involved in chromosome partitioning or flagellar assembly [Nocardiopsis sp. Huas11]|uniref:TcpE family conjugal transfer membrane protein n=1 Tax=Nocardiopsis sp. Huas11 TaxID=2183912 RepID=UPI000EAD9FD8|nr:TcpE family conjugal transfer membrane protein [Nocardiopsis sp. Huas11]RKS10797.1 MinD-like ATPase involved in chromosome partitioning or flagellar assembly [Nocardiopsis sp. Huas11]
MDLPTYTNIWRIEKRLYKLYDFRLPMPLPVGTFGVALGVFALWVILLSILNAPFAFGNGWHLVMWVVPPGVITVLATRPVIEGKRLTELLISQARFLTEARVYTRLAPEYEPAEVRVSVRVWHRDPEAGPLPVVGRRRVERAAVEPEQAAVEDAVARPEAAPPLVGLPVSAAEAAAAPAEDTERIEAAERIEPVEAEELARASAPLERSEPFAVSTRPEPVDEPQPEPEPEPRPRRAVEPERRPARARERERAREPERERVPVAAAALSGRRGDDAVAGRAEEPVHDLEDGVRDDDAVRRPGMGRRVLNYFGFGLGAAPPEAPGEATGSGGGDGAAEEEDFTDFDQEAVHATEDEERTESQDWFARLRASSGETPVGLTSKSAYSVGDTGAMSREDLADAVAETDHDRRRAEEVMAAPESADDESPAARRLRGRAQGIQVTRDLEERRSDQAREPAPQTPPRPQGQGQGLPAREEGDKPEPPRRRGRPHAAPWELERGGVVRRGSAEPDGQADLFDYAARFAAATGRPAAPEPAAAPWLPPAAATPAPEPSVEEADGAEESEATEATEEVARSRTEAPADDAGTADAGEPAVQDGPATTLGDARTPTGTDEAAPGEAPADTDTATPRPSAKPALEIDHGTGEQAALPPQPNEGAQERGPEWDEHMSVLDQHLIKADTPAPPRPTFADVVPAQERDVEATDPGEWFDDGKKRHPDQPKVGDRDNPVIPAGELREAAEAAEAAETAGAAEAEETRAPEETKEPEAGTGEAKPPTQLDHGTGELVSFVEVRDEPARAVPRRTPGSVEGASTERPAEAPAAGTEQPTPAAERRTTDAPAFAGSWTVEEPARAAGHRPRDTDEGATAERSADGRTEEDTGVTARRTAEDLAAAEAAALARRRAAAAEGPGVRDPRANPSMATTRGDERSTAAAPENGNEDTRTEAPAAPAAPAAEGGKTATRTEAPAEDAPHTSVEHDPHDGVFHRVAQNARRLGQLFGQPAPGEEPAPPGQDESKPALELDHGTGEQDRLGDTPNGVPTHRPDPERVEREEPSSDSGGTRGWRRLAKVVTGGAAPVRSDLPASDIERLRTPLDSPCGLVVLGCTGGAGQTVTTLMIGHTLAAHRDDRIVAVDVNPGPNGLSRRVGAQSPETLTALLANADSVEDYAHMRAYASRAGTGLEVVQTLDDPYVQTLDERDYTQLTRLLGGFYSVTLLDPAATGVARSLPGADGLVLVAPASADAERAVSMTFDWLDGNGYGALRANSVLVVNGVSKRSLGDVDAAERVARGRCRAIVRIPWDDHLGSSYTKIDVGALRPATKRAHGALGRVLVSVLTGSR